MLTLTTRKNTAKILETWESLLKHRTFAGSSFWALKMATEFSVCFPCLTIAYHQKLYAHNSATWHHWITKSIESKLTAESRKGAFESLPEVRAHPHTWSTSNDSDATTYPFSQSLFNALSPLIITTLISTLQA